MTQSFASNLPVGDARRRQCKLKEVNIRLGSSSCNVPAWWREMAQSKASERVRKQRKSKNAKRERECKERERITERERERERDKREKAKTE
jgi:hypothetical protein